MTEAWTLEKINQLISNQVQESLNLEYKAAPAFDKIDQKKKMEITKDVAAMANSAGGTIIYGIKEYSEKDKKYLPKEIDPISQNEFPKEWLEQVINTIRPKIDDIRIVPVTLNQGNDSVVYVVEIPQSDTAHQSQDYRYYKRFNFVVNPMDDYEVRDVMGRRHNPKIDLHFTIILKNREPVKHSLIVDAKNTGLVYAKYVNISIEIPLFIVPRDGYSNDNSYFWEIDNTVRDRMEEHPMVFNPSKIPSDVKISYGPPRYVPILPGLSRSWELELKDLGKALPMGVFSKEDKIKWTIYADNASPISGEEYLSDIEFKKEKEY
jgi:hypothetical protein